jgi:hypothetical protein
MVCTQCGITIDAETKDPNKCAATGTLLGGLLTGLGLLLLGLLILLGALLLGGGDLGILGATLLGAGGGAALIILDLLGLGGLGALLAGALGLDAALLCCNCARNSESKDEGYRHGCGMWYYFIFIPDVGALQAVCVPEMREELPAGRVSQFSPQVRPSRKHNGSGEAAGHCERAGANEEANCCCARVK